MSDNVAFARVSAFEASVSELARGVPTRVHDFSTEKEG